MQFLPALLFTMPAGQLVDRVDRRGVLAASLVVQAVVAFVLTWGELCTAAVGRDLIFALCVSWAWRARCRCLRSRRSYPRWCRRRSLPRAFAMSVDVAQVAIIGGPALGGFIYALRPGGRLRRVPRAARRRRRLFVRSIQRIPVPPEAKERVSFDSLFAGFGFIWRKKPVLGAISLDLFAVLLGGATALLPIYAKDILDTGPWGLGLLRARPRSARWSSASSSPACRWSATSAAGCSSRWRSTASRSSCSGCRATSCCRWSRWR